VSVVVVGKGGGLRRSNIAGAQKGYPSPPPARLLFLLGGVGCRGKEGRAGSSYRLTYMHPPLTRPVPRHAAFRCPSITQANPKQKG